MILPDQVENFLHTMRIERQASAHTLDAYRRDLSDFCSWLRGRNPVKASEKDVQRYLLYCSRRNLSPATITRRISALRELFKELQRARRIRRDPMRRIVAPKGWKRLPKAIAVEEALKLLDFPLGMFQNKLRGLRDRAIIELFWASGIRVSELTSAKLADLDLENRTIRVFGKGEKDRLAPFGEPAARALHTYLMEVRPKFLKRHASPYLFLGRWGRRMTRERVWQMINERAAQVGLPHLSPHVMRHTCATHLVENNADLRTVQEILGHADVTTTQGYLKASPLHLKKVLARCHPRNNGKHRQMRLFDPKTAPLVGRIICSQCLQLAAEGKTMCERHLVLARIARKRHYAKKKRAKAVGAPQTRTLRKAG
jgi:integrase/recombinase XerD